MTKPTCTLILISLISTLFALSLEEPAQPLFPILSGEAERYASPPSTGEAPGSAASIGDVLGAHMALQNPEALSGFDADAVRLTSRPAGIDPETPSFFERRVAVVLAGNLYRRHITDPLKLREQIDIFDGIAGYHSVAEIGKQREIAIAAESQVRGAEFGVETFGLTPILKQLLDPSTVVVHIGRSACGHDKFDVKTATARWTLYSDAEHLISRVDVRNKTIEYAGYRLVDGIRLPLIERLSRDGRLVQEIVFTRIELNPKTPSEYFSRGALSADNAH